MRANPMRMFVLGVAFAISGCGSGTSDPSSTETGGSVGSGGGSGTATGGSSGLATGGGAADPTGGNATGGVATGGTAAGGASTGGTPPEAFELQGSWLYLGPWDEVHTLQISDASMVYADVDGEWSSNWTIEGYDNTLDHFQLAFESGSGTYSPTGQHLSGAYGLSDQILTVQLAEGSASYPPVESPGSCIEEGANRIPDCGLYMHQN